MLPHFYYDPKILDYDFGASHPLRPERLRRTIELLTRYGVEPILPEAVGKVQALRVHQDRYVDFVEELSRSMEAAVDNVQRRSGFSQSIPSFPEGIDPEEAISHGFGSGDNPPFAGMFESAMAYLTCTVRAAEAVRDGANLAFGIGGGHHHAAAAKASGFCIFDDPAVACHVLRDRFDRVAYIDIDVHHGDGPQWLFYDDPTVLTISIHEDGRSLFPGTGHLHEVGADYTSLNIPLEAGTSGDTWLWAFDEIVPRAIERFDPGAIVLQMGTDPHVLDPLAHLNVLQQDWLGAVHSVKALDRPIAALGGGGYNLTTVPRMWASACLTLGDLPYEDPLPQDLAKEWSIPTYSDRLDISERGIGRESAERVVKWLRENHAMAC